MTFNWEKILSSETETPRSERREYDKRSPFDSDYSRITFSSPFRRLQDKTQVFPLEKNDFVRTRLTHSIEVASIARSLGKDICSKLNEIGKYGWKKEYGNDICVILECAGLVHDIGNPPFGHSSEKAIQNWFASRKKELLVEIEGQDANLPAEDIEQKLKDSQRIQDFLNFDGNVQGFRILTHLQCVFDYKGYHLTSALLATTMKYPVDSVTGNKNKDSIDHKYKKFAYFESERKSAEFVLSSCGLIDGKDHYRSPLTFILEAADDIAYSAADIEDGFKKGLFSLKDLLTELESKKDDECINSILEEAKKHIEDEKLLEERKIHWLRICIHQVYCDIVVKEFIDNYDKIMTGVFKEELLTAGSLKTLRKLLENFSIKHLINNQEVSKLEIAGRNVIRFLLDEFSNDLIVNGLNKLNGKTVKTKDSFNELQKAKSWNLISEDFKDVFYHTISEKSPNGNICKHDVIYYTYLLITDFISGMTDNYCIGFYRRLMGIDIS